MVKRIAYILGLLLALVGCGPKTTAEGDPIMGSTENVLNYLKSHPPAEASFRLAVSDSYTFMGKQDASGAGIALVVAELYKRGYRPDGPPEKKSGYRIVRFKRTQ
ncbi:MAG TPA: hypothetical protein VN281_17920 [Verrucomicrobiae bacterium]|jgi:hypothetical protein|nr:hypothetical protein [Verrucomicrobiae bacterium]